MRAMLQVHDLVPHFSVATVDGAHVDYNELWQRTSLLLVCLQSRTATADAYAAALKRQFAEDVFREAACIITLERITRVPSPGAVIADRWGEIFFVSAASNDDELPAPDELIGWLQYVQVHCPECEGEAR